MLMQLASHYYRPDFTPAQVAQLMADMVADLEEFNLAEVEVSVRHYRRDAEKRFFPRAADLRDLILRERRDRAGTHGRQARPEFGDHRPLDWEYVRKRFWAKHWRADDLNTASDPQRRARYDKWLRLVKADKIKGCNPNDY